MAKKYNEIEVQDNMQVKNEENVEAAPKERKELSKVISAEPKKVEKTLLGRLITGVAGPDGLPGIGAYVNEEIIKPAIKNIIVDAVTSGINMVMYGERGGTPRGGRPMHHGGQTPHNYRPSTSYNTNYRQAEPQAERLAPRTSRSLVEEYVIADRVDAAHVLASLTEHADMYDSVSVADYYDLIGVPTNYTDNNHGWTIDTVTRATIIPVRGGYVIKFPPTEVI